MMSLQLAPAAGCVKTEQVAQWLGHDYSLAPFYTNTHYPDHTVDAQLQYTIAYRYPGNPPLRITIQPDHDRSGCFRFIMADSKPSP